MRQGPNAVNKAVHEAVSAIYFADNSDYLPALWSVVRLLAPDMAEMLEKDERLAWQTSDDLANATPNVEAQAGPRQRTSPAAQG